MAGSASITRRKTKSGLRYAVRYRRGGRLFPGLHGGSFKTQREARERRDLILGELAAGRDPAAKLRAAPTVRVTLARVVGAVRRQPRGSRAVNRTKRRGCAEADSADLRRPRPVRDHLAGRAELDRQPRAEAVVRLAVPGDVKGGLDFAEIDPNPASDRGSSCSASRGRASCRRRRRRTRSCRVPLQYRLPLAVLEQTGMRVGELSS